MGRSKKKQLTYEFFDKIWYARVYKHPTLGNGLVIKFSDKIEFNFGNLMEISKYFGTEQIDFESYHIGKCDTCGCEEEDGFDVYIYKITKNNPF